MRACSINYRTDVAPSISAGFMTRPAHALSFYLPIPIPATAPALALACAPIPTPTFPRASAPMLALALATAAKPAVRDAAIGTTACVATIAAKVDRSMDGRSGMGSTSWVGTGAADAVNTASVESRARDNRTGIGSTSCVVIAAAGVLDAAICVGTGRDNSSVNVVRTSGVVEVSEIERGGIAIDMDSVAIDGGENDKDGTARVGIESVGTVSDVIEIAWLGVIAADALNPGAVTVIVAGPGHCSGLKYRNWWRCDRDSRKSRQCASDGNWRIGNQSERRKSECAHSGNGEYRKRQGASRSECQSEPGDGSSADWSACAKDRGRRGDSHSMSQVSFP